MERRDTPLSDEAVAVAQAWQKLVPELQKSTKEMILSMADQIDKYGPAVEDSRVEEVYGRPGHKPKHP
jgi:hypothetical protein